MPRSTDNNRLGRLIDRFAALPPEEQRRQIDEANRYLASAEGQREIGHLLRNEVGAENAAPEQGSH